MKQQYFTRERKGVYSNTPGYDTVAKSEGLSDNFIKNVLHPFCLYDVPEEISSSGNIDHTQCPDSITCLQPESGELVLGRAVAAGLDYTGSRNVYFVHNLVFSKDEKESHVKSMEKFLHVNSFEGSYDIEKGTMLPDIDNLNFNNSTGLNHEAIFRNLGIDETIFKKMVYAVFLSLNNKRKIFVSLDVNPSDISKYSRILLEYIIAALPYDLRRSFGFMTYLNRPKEKRYINIMFVERGSMNKGDNISRAYVFDLQKKKLMNVDFDLSKQYFLDFAWENLKNRNKLNDFYSIVDDVVAGMSADKKLSIDTYNELCRLYELKNGNEEIYRMNKEGIFNSLYKFFNSKDAGNKEWFKDMLRTRFISELSELSKTGFKTYSSKEIINTFIQHYDRTSETNDIINNIIAMSMKNAYSRMQFAYIGDLFENISKNNDMSTNFINFIYKNSERYGEVFNWRIKENFHKARDLEKLFETTTFWIKTLPGLVSNESFIELFKVKAFQLLDVEGNAVVPSSKVLKFLEEIRAKAYGQDTLYIMGFRSDVYDRMFESIRIGDLTENDIMIMELEDNNSLDEKIKAIKILKEFILAKGGRSLQLVGDKFAKLSERYRNEVLKALESLCKNEIGLGNFGKIILALSDISYNEEISYNYERVLSYISKNGGEEAVSEFLLWASENNALGQSEGEKRKFKNAVIKYIERENIGLLKDSKLRKSLFNGVNGELFKDISKELSGGVKRFFNGIGERISDFFSEASWVDYLLLVILLILIVGVVVLTVLSWDDITAFITGLFKE